MSKDISPRKSLKMKSEELSWIVNVSLASAKIKKLTLQEPHKDFQARAPLHVMLRAPIGSVKSTILQEISSIVGNHVMLEITKPGLVGTIDGKMQEMIPGTAWECRNSLMLIDEFNFNAKNNPKECFLQLLEQQRWARRFGVFSRHQKIEDGDLYFEVDKGLVNLKTRFACIIGTMKNFGFMRGQAFRAMLTRTAPLEFFITKDELEYIAEGDNLYTYKDFKVDPEITVKRQRYMKIKKEVIHALEKHSAKPETVQEIMLRTIGDCCRIYAVTSKNNQSLFSKIVKWKVDAHETVGSYYQGKKVI